jgi:hypothetical protein
MAKKQTDIELRSKLNELLLMYRRCILRHAATIRNPERVFIDYEGGPYVYVLYSDSGLSWTCCTHDFNLGGSLLGTYGSDVHMYALDGLLGLGLLNKTEHARLLKMFHDESDSAQQDSDIEKACKLLHKAGYRVVPPITAGGKSGKRN